MRAAALLVVAAGAPPALALALALAAGAPAASAPSLVKVRDARGDVDGAPDLTRLSVGRASGGMLRATVTLAEDWTGRDLRAARDGPPGSLCLKVWTTTAPPAATPDRLVCVTATADGALRGTVLRERPNQLPERAGAATVTRASGRTVAVRFAVGSLGAPAATTASFAAEAVRAGCNRATCTDLAPDAPTVLRLTLPRGR